MKAKPHASTRFLSAVLDIARPRFLDLFEGRHAPQLDQWLTEQSASAGRGWSVGVGVGWLAAWSEGFSLGAHVGEHADDAFELLDQAADLFAGQIVLTGLATELELGGLRSRFTSSIHPLTIEGSRRPRGLSGTWPAWCRTLRSTAGAQR